MPDQPFVFTLCDAESERLDFLRSSLHDNLFVLKTYCSTLGNLSKIFKVRDFLLSSTHLPDDQIIIFVDAYDVLCVRYELEELVEKFKSTGQDLIMGAESIFCHHRSKVLPFFLETYMSEPARYLNSGFVVAYKWAYLSMLNYIANNFVTLFMDRHHHSDQRAISTFMLHNVDLNLIKMGIDSQRQYCHTHTYADNPLDLSLISAYFVHVTWLALDIQKQAYDAIRDHFLR